MARTPGNSRKRRHRNRNFVNFGTVGISGNRAIGYGTGFDFWLGYKENPENYDPDNFLNARVEISGIDNGNRA